MKFLIRIYIPQEIQSLDRHMRKEKFALRKITVGILAAFAVAFICMSFAVKFANDGVYAFLYPYEERSFAEDRPGTAVLEVGDYFACGEYAGERLVWKCVSEGKAQCERIIEFKRYDSNDSDWESSELRDWLNSVDGFCGMSALTDHNIVRGEVYVLSVDELAEVDDRAKQPSLHAIRNSDSKYLFLRKNCWYWTSSSISTNSHSVAAVTQNGGFYKTLATDELTGICPAINLSSSTVKILGGDGSKQKPFVIGE